MYRNGLDKEFKDLKGIEHVSKLLPYAGLILTVSCVSIFMVRLYILEPLVKRFYGEKFSRLDQAQQRTFINHWVAGGCKLVLIIGSCYPAIAVVSGRYTLQSPFAGSKTVKLGDTLICTFQLFTAMYIFELFYRKSISYISAAHHIGAIVIAQSSTVLFLDPAHRSDAPLEFILCLLWGFFDICAEFWPHAAVIIYRTWPNKHKMLSRVFLATAILELIGTTVETITVLSIFFSLWKHWTIEFKILSPTLHILFSMAQLWGGKVFWEMSQSQRRKSKKQGLADVEQCGHVAPGEKEDSDSSVTSGEKEYTHRSDVKKVMQQEVSPV